MSHRDWDLACKVYIGNLGNNASKQEIETAFSKYGPLKNIWIARNPPGFAFVEFEDHRDAEDAVRGLDGSRLDGQKIRVEMSSGRSRGRNSGGGGGGYSGGGGGRGMGGRDYGGGREYNRGGGGGNSYRGGGGDNYNSRYNRSRSRSPKRRMASRSPHSRSPPSPRYTARDKR